MRTIRVCAGIGDNLWVLQKLVNAGQKFHFKIAGDKPRRGHQIFDLLPQITASYEYASFDSGQVIKRDASGCHNPKGPQLKYSHFNKDDFYLCCNHHLERGQRLEEWLPDLETSYLMDYTTSDSDQNEAFRVLQGVTEDDLVIGLYGSCYSVLRHWNFWQPDTWALFADYLNLNAKRNVVFVVVGASFDLDLGQKMITELEGMTLTHRNCIGKSLGCVVEVMKRMDAFFSFPSGLGVLSSSLNIPTMFFYPPHLDKMKNAWASPEAIETKRYVPMDFVPPQEALKSVPKEWLQ